MQLTDILSYLFKFKLSFVRELVLFKKWYQEASHTQCLNLNLNSLLVKRQIDNPSPGAMTGGN